MGGPSKHPVDPRLGLRLRQIRRARGLTQRELAEAVGCCLRTVRDFERLRTSIEWRRAHQIAIALNAEYVCDFVPLDPFRRGAAEAT
jgi:transcriptional regulator with XRE-family HTH domain